MLRFIPLLALAVVALQPQPCLAIVCGVPQTLPQQAASADITAIGHLTFPKIGKERVARVVIDDVLIGGKLLGETKSVDASTLPEGSVGQRYLLIGYAKDDKINWNAPFPVSPVFADYLQRRLKLPESAAKRLKFFLPFLEHKEEIIADDVADELLKLKGDELAVGKADFNNKKLVEWTSDKDTPVKRKRLYFHMLGVSGGMTELIHLQSVLRSPSATDKHCLDVVMWSCFQLGGVDAARDVQTLYIENPNAEFASVYCAIMAFRHDARFSQTLPRETRLAAFRRLVRRPMLADLVIGDLAFEKDWSMIQPLKELFLSGTKESAWAKIPIIQYLSACPLDEAKEALHLLEESDPKAFKRAREFHTVK